MHGCRLRRGAVVAGQVRSHAAGAGTAAGRLLPVGAGQPGNHRQGPERLIEAARAGEDLDPGRARHVRVIEYEVPDRDGDGKGELIALVTTITDLPAGPGGRPG